MRNKILTDIFNRKTGPIKLGLDRMKNAASELGNPQNSFKSIHIAGSNGKGSVASFSEALLRSRGFKTALYTSPHIVNFEERFLINGNMINSEEWLSLYYDLEYIIEKYELTFFEVSTLIAFELFKRNGVEWAVIETGLGGRLDATNVLIPEISLITSISVEHTNYLGNTIAEIASEKSGIIKRKVPVVFQMPDSEDVLEVLESKAIDMGCDYFSVSLSDVVIKERKLTAFTYEHKDREITILTPGRYQIINSLQAIMSYEILGFELDNKALSAIRNVKVPGRFHIASVGEKSIVFDVSHNPEAVCELTSLLCSFFEGKRICTVVGVMADKDIFLVISKLAEISNEIVFVKPNVARSADITELFNIPHGKELLKFRFDSVADGVAFSLKRECDVVLVTGSFYTVGEAVSFLGPDLLDFN